MWFGQPRAIGRREVADFARPLRRGVLCWRRDTSGNALVEFALVAPAFLALIIAILHTALIYLAQEGLQTAAEASSRLLMTGSAQTIGIGSGGTAHTGMSATEFKQAICTGISGTDARGNSVRYPGALPPFLSCSKLAVNVQVVPSGCTNPALNAPTYTYTNGVLTSTGSGFGAANCAGTTNSNNGIGSSQNQLVVVQLSYLWPTAVGPLGLNFTNQPGGNRLMVATTVLTVEAYSCPSGASSC
jgi:Flp pilus assembly protein TadG